MKNPIASQKCTRCMGTGFWETGNNDLPCSCLRPVSFHTLHTVYHERDFRVHVNDVTVERVRACLAADSVTIGTAHLFPKELSICPACWAGYDV